MSKRINVEFESPSKTFEMIEPKDFIICFNGTRGYVESKDSSKYYIKLDTQEEFHILSVKEVVKR